MLNWFDHAHYDDAVEIGSMRRPDHEYALPTYLLISGFLRERRESVRANESRFPKLRRIERNGCLVCVFPAKPQTFEGFSDIQVGLRCMILCNSALLTILEFEMEDNRHQDRNISTLLKRWKTKPCLSDQLFYFIGSPWIHEWLYHVLFWTIGCFCTFWLLASALAWAFPH